MRTTTESQGNCTVAMKSKIYDDVEQNTKKENKKKRKKRSEPINEGCNDDFSEKVKRKKKKTVGNEHSESDLSALQQDLLSTSHDEDVVGKVERKKKNVPIPFLRTTTESQGNCTVAMKSNIYDDVEQNTKKENKKKREKKSEPINEGCNEDFSEKVKRKKKKTVGNEHSESDLSALQQDLLSTSHDEDVVGKVERKKKKTKTRDNGVEKVRKGKNKKHKPVVDNLDESTSPKNSKKVRFSGEDEVFSFPVESNNEKRYDEENLLRGKRFTPEEDEIIKEAVDRYIEDHDLGENGLEMVLNVRKNPKVRGCWQEIGAEIPYRPYTAVYYRAQVLFRRGDSRKWTQEELDMILQYQELHGNEWKELAEELGRHRFHVKDTWRRIKLRNQNKGHWSQNEYQSLFDLVNTDLQLKLSEEKKSKHGMLRDNICWTAISDKLSTRAMASCCIKWYDQLTSPMVAEGLWADSDDYRLLRELYQLDESCREDVDWDNLLEHRSGDLCRKRWNQMTLHIGHHSTKPFSEQVDALARRYCPHLVEAREIWDNKPRVP